MVDFVIDVTVDLPKKFVEKNDIKVVPLYILKDEEKIKVDFNFKYKFYKDRELKDLWLKGKLKTSQPSLEDFLEIYKDCEDEILVFTVSSKLSGTYNVALNASKMVNKKIYVVDTLNASVGSGLLVMFAKKISEKYKFENLIKKIEKLKYKIKTFAFIENIEYLLRSGRINILKYSFLRLINKKPIITVKDGSLELYKLSSDLYKDFEELEKNYKIKLFGTNSKKINKKEILINPIISVNLGLGFGFSALK
ncbi:MAG: DegV family protein [Candidatus Aenigmatarchaeota archaeon]